jgi:Flp pilus assembly protein TadG
MLTRRQPAFKTFGNDDAGSIAILFGLLTSVLFLMGAIAIDYTRIVDMRSRVLSAVDAASLAAGRALLDGQLSDSQIVDLATAYFDHDVAPARKMGTVGVPAVTINRNAGTVDINVNSSVNMTWARITGIDSMDMPVSSSAAYKQRDIEVGMALDITGSMDQIVGGISKLDALKNAFAEFTNQLIPDYMPSTQKVRIGIAPYSSGINLGSYAGVASSGRSTDGCVTERKNNIFDDESPTSTPFYVKADGKNDIDDSDGNTPSGAYSCPSARLVPLTKDKTSLINAVNKFSAGGWTAGHLGIQWAWNLVSDQWSGTFSGSSAPDPYSEVTNDKLIKAVVLMTDGSFNTAYHGNKATGDNWSKNQAVKLCDAMKAADKNVVVFSVAFDAPLDAQQTLQACASSGTGYYANASSPEDLQKAFQNFATKLSQLRIAR